MPRMAKRVNCLPRFVMQRCSSRYWSVLLREPVSMNTEKIVLTSWISSGMGLSLQAFFTLPSTVTLDRLSEA